MIDKCNPKAHHQKAFFAIITAYCDIKCFLPLMQHNIVHNMPRVGKNKKMGTPSRGGSIPVCTQKDCPENVLLQQALQKKICRKEYFS